MTVIQCDVGGGLRMPNGGQIGGRARVMSHSRGFGGDWRMMEERFFCETFISYRCYRCIYKIGLSPENSVSNSSSTRRASLPTSENTQPHSMRTLIQASSPLRMAVHRLITSSRSLAARCVSHAWSSD